MTGVEFGMLVTLPFLFLVLFGLMFIYNLKELKVNREIDLRNADVKEKMVNALRDKVEVRISTEDLKELLK